MKPIQVSTNYGNDTGKTVVTVRSKTEFLFNSFFFSNCSAESWPLQDDVDLLRLRETRKTSFYLAKPATVAQKHKRFLLIFEL